MEGPGAPPVAKSFTCNVSHFLSEYNTAFRKLTELHVCPSGASLMPPAVILFNSVHSKYTPGS